MKNTKQIFAIILTLLMLISTASINGGAIDEEFYVKIRIEGVDSNIYNGAISTSEHKSLTVAEALMLLDDINDSIAILGADTGYITEVNGIKAGSYNPSKWDGWYYTVNNVSADCGISDYNLNDGDSIVLYYGDYPCYIPQIDTSWLSANGTIKFTATDTTFEYAPETDQWISKTVTVPITDMTVTLDGSYEYVTDENGEIKVNIEEFMSNSSIQLQVDKKSTYGAPAVCRYAPNFKISISTRYTTLLGDVNSTNQIDINDATLAQMYVAQLQQPTPQDFITADVNVDYDLTIVDATHIQMYVAKYINSFNVTE